MKNRIVDVSKYSLWELGLFVCFLNWENASEKYALCENIMPISREVCKCFILEIKLMQSKRYVKYRKVCDFIELLEMCVTVWMNDSNCEMYVFVLKEN